MFQSLIKISTGRNELKSDILLDIMKIKNKGIIQITAMK